MSCYNKGMFRIQVLSSTDSIFDILSIIKNKFDSSLGF